MLVFDGRIAATAHFLRYSSFIKLIEIKQKVGLNIKTRLYIYQIVLIEINYVITKF